MEGGGCYGAGWEARILDMCHLAGWACESGEGSPGRARTREALEHRIALGLGVRRDADGGRYFDPCEVLNFVKQAGLDGRDAFWSERVVGTARQLVVDMRNDDPHQFTVELRRTFNTRSLPAGVALRLRMPLPLTSDHLGDLEGHPHAAAAGPKHGSTVRVGCRSIFPVGNCRAAVKIRHGAITSSGASTAA